MFLGAIRPHLGSPKRATWFLAHQVWGILTLCLGTTNCYIGISIIVALASIPLASWLAPALAVTCCLVVAGVVLELRKVQLQRAGRFNPETQEWVPVAAVAKSSVV